MMRVTASIVSSRFSEEFGWWMSLGNPRKFDQAIHDTIIQTLGDFYCVGPPDIVHCLAEWLRETHKIAMPFEMHRYPEAPGYQLPCPPCSFEIHACFSVDTARHFFREIEKLNLSPDDWERMCECYPPIEDSEPQSLSDYLNFLSNCCEALESEEHRLLIYSEKE